VIPRPFLALHICGSDHNRLRTGALSFAYRRTQADYSGQKEQRAMIKKNPSAKPLPIRSDGSSAPPMRLGTVREACAYGRFSHTKCYDFINTGRIDAFKRDNRTFIDFNSIDAMHAAVLTKIEPKGKPSL
jgi:hypothetical protein